MTQEYPVEYSGPLVDHPSYPAPKRILTHKEGYSEEDAQRSLETPASVKVMEKVGDGDRIQDRLDNAIRPTQMIAVNDDVPNEGDKESESSGRGEESATVSRCEEYPAEGGPTKSSVYRHDAGNLYAEDVDQHMALLSEITVPMEKVAIEDIQVGDPGVPLTDDQEKLK